MHLIPTSPRRQASPALRDRFLTALDERDEATVRNTARDLLGCENSLPTTTCTELGLAAGSTYGDAAKAMTLAPPWGGPAFNQLTDTRERDQLTNSTDSRRGSEQVPQAK